MEIPRVTLRRLDGTGREGVGINVTMRGGQLDVDGFIESIRTYISSTRARLLPWLNDTDKDLIENAFESVEEWLNGVFQANFDAAQDGSPRSVEIPKDQLRCMELTVNEALRRNISSLQADIDLAAGN